MPTPPASRTLALFEEYVGIPQDQAGEWAMTCPAGRDRAMILDRRPWKFRFLPPVYPKYDPGRPAHPHRPDAALEAEEARPSPGRRAAPGG